jgi:hypothetical protein
LAVHITELAEESYRLPEVVVAVVEAAQPAQRPAATRSAGSCGRTPGAGGAGLIGIRFGDCVSSARTAVCR